MWVVCDETYEMWQGRFEGMDIPDDLKLNEQTVRQIKALRLWAMNRRRHSAGGHLLGQQAMEVSSQARAAMIARDAKMRPAGVCVDGGATMLRLPAVSQLRAVIAAPLRLACSTPIALGQQVGVDLHAPCRLLLLVRGSLSVLALGYMHGAVLLCAKILKIWRRY